jgi:UDP-galactopyranose mutase
MERPLIVGAGLSGAVVARILAEGGIPSIVVDERHHIAGNCHTDIDETSGIMIHRYGPHIFHTDDQDVWTFVNEHARFEPYVHRVKAVVQGQVYSMPINLHSINQFFGTTMNPNEAAAFVQSKSEPFDDPANFEEQAMSMVGREIYEGFFAGYTRKQWGVEPTSLPASILKRLPLRFNYDDNYFNHRFQGMPADGYTAMVASILDHELIEVRLGETFNGQKPGQGGHVFFSGPLDQYFDYRAGKLGYRTLDFEEVRSEDDYQGTAVINYCDEDTPWTRITDHKYFSPWRLNETRGSVAYKEYSRSWSEGDTRYYPIRLVDDKKMLADYVELVGSAEGVTFMGRLGTYRYLDMDKTIAEAMVVGQGALTAFRNGASPKSSYADLSV